MGEGDPAANPWRDTVRLLAVIAVAAFVVVSLFIAVGWMEERNGQHGCEQQYGEDVEYVGDTSAFGGLAICEVDGEQRYAKPSMGWLAGAG